jgi:hypothetical protein
MDYMNANSTATYPTLTQVAQPASTAQSQREELEKALHHLAGRAAELRARLEPVLNPERSSESGSMPQAEGIDASPAANHTWRMKRVAADAISTVEDILNRLDV